MPPLPLSTTTSTFHYHFLFPLSTFHFHFQRSGPRPILLSRTSVSLGSGDPGAPKGHAAGTSREVRSRTMVQMSSGAPSEPDSRSADSVVGDDPSRFRGLSDLDDVFGMGDEKASSAGRTSSVGAGGATTYGSFSTTATAATTAPTPSSAAKGFRGSMDRGRGASSSVGVDDSEELPWQDDDRQQLESVLNLSISRAYVFLAGDLNYRLCLPDPEKALRAIHTAANDPVR
jgi:hypothetical protein